MDPEPSLAFSANLDTQLILGLVGIISFLFLSAITSASEVALFSLSAKDIETLNKQNIRATKAIQKLLEKPKKLLATILVVNNFFNLAVVVFFSHYFHNYFTFLAPYLLQILVEVMVVAFLLLLFGEVLPKVYAYRNRVSFSIFIAFPLTFANHLLSPISMPIRNVTLFLTKKLGKQKTNFSVDQLSQALELTSSEDTTDEEQKILEGIVSFGNTDTKQVMSPRVDIFALDIEAPFSEIYPKIVEKGYSRIPIYKDNIDAIKGVLFVKDLIPYINEVKFNWQELIREPFFVPENKKLDNLLKDFQTKKSHLAIVVDEYGGTSGLVSLEDIIEEIVGDISDEFDEENINFTKIDDQNYLFEGKINLKDFYRIINVDETLFEIRKGEAETLAGLILEMLGNFPKKGQKISFENCIFTIETVDKRRIKQIKVTLNAT